jgi:hypothetical protein
LVSDLNKDISRAYGVLLPAGIALRGLFLIDKSGIVRHQIVNDLPLGRSVDEALRMVKALQYFTARFAQPTGAKGPGRLKPPPSKVKGFLPTSMQERASGLTRAGVTSKRTPRPRNGRETSSIDKKTGYPASLMATYSHNSLPKCANRPIRT